METPAGDPEYVDSLSETLEILSDPHELAALRRGIADLEAGRLVSVDELRAELALGPD